MFVIRILISSNTVFVTLLYIVKAPFLECICFTSMIFSKCTISPPTYDVSVFHKIHACNLSVVTRGYRGWKLERRCCKLVAMRKVSYTFLTFRWCLHFIKLDLKYGLKSPNNVCIFFSSYFQNIKKLIFFLNAKFIIFYKV